MGETIMTIEGLNKTFAGQRALIDVSISARAGQIHALVGANGSGKSTLIKILAGYYEPDPEPAPLFEFLGEPAALGDQHWRKRSHFIHQDLGLVPTRNAVENIALVRGFVTGRLGRVRWRRTREEARALLSEYGVDFDLDVPVSQLSRSSQTMIAIVRALDGWDDTRGVLVLDEPTAALSPSEITPLFEAMRRVAARGSSVIFVSHRLEEVLEVADWVTVLRNGRVVGDRPVDGLDSKELIAMIVGRHLDDLYVEPPPVGSGVLLRAEGLTGATLAGVDFELRRGEILGIGGLRGSGRDEIVPALAGGLDSVSGTIWIDESPLPLPLEPGAAMARGIGYVPIDRLGEGSIPRLSVRENVTLPDLSSFTRASGFISRASEREEVRTWMDKLDIRPPDPERGLGTLSGGNQQKAVIAKQLRLGPRVLVLDEPTQGVDVGARAAIHGLLAEFARSGAGIVMSSSESEELANVCDRVLVLRHGGIVAELEGSRLTEPAVLHETLGGKLTGAGMER